MFYYLREYGCRTFGRRQIAPLFQRHHSMSFYTTLLGKKISNIQTHLHTHVLPAEVLVFYKEKKISQNIYQVNFFNKIHVFTYP